MRRLNFPIGVSKPLQLTSSALDGASVKQEGLEELKKDKGTGRLRWLLPIHILDGIFAALGEQQPTMAKPGKGKPILEDLKKVVQDGALSCCVSLSPHFVLLQKSFYTDKMKSMWQSGC
uniref:Uncharacterized protein n=1 Tax=uncultured organism MedDCM-OCT-S08-C51 TaxID=743639 RepID=D6PJA4_9ZZZZ|nr:hypothetical protein [uncultured organism MedDCM-OCT-S08-C51]